MKTNGDAIREMSNEQLADIWSKDRINIMQAFFAKYNIDFDNEAYKHQMYCALLEYLNRQMDDK